MVVGGGDFMEHEIKLFSIEALERVRFISSANNDELNVLFNSATALIYPSSYERFGIPDVEAMRPGFPVIGLDNATIIEVAENSAILLKNLNISDFNNNKENLFNISYRTEIIEKNDCLNHKNTVGKSVIKKRMSFIKA